jgi:hypothetical protein
MTTEKLEDIKGLSDINHRTDNTITTEKLEDIKGLSDINHRTDNTITTEKLEDMISSSFSVVILLSIL